MLESNHWQAIKVKPSSNFSQFNLLICFNCYPVQYFICSAYLYLFAQVFLSHCFIFLGI